MRFFFQVFSRPWGSLRGIFEWINVEKKKKKAGLHFEIPVFQEYFLHCSVSFLFLLKRYQINGFLAEISKKKFPRKLHLSSPLHRWHYLQNRTTFTLKPLSLHNRFPLWRSHLMVLTPSTAAGNSPGAATCTISALQSSWLERRWLCYANHHSHC